MSDESEPKNAMFRAIAEFFKQLTLLAKRVEVLIDEERAAKAQRR